MTSQTILVGMCTFIGAFCLGKKGLGIWAFMLAYLLLTGQIKV